MPYLGCLLGLKLATYETACIVACKLLHPAPMDKMQTERKSWLRQVPLNPNIRGRGITPMALHIGSDALGGPDACTCACGLGRVTPRPGQLTCAGLSGKHFVTPTYSLLSCLPLLLIILHKPQGSARKLTDV